MQETADGYSKPSKHQGTKLGFLSSVVPLISQEQLGIWLCYSKLNSTVAGFHLPTPVLLQINLERKLLRNAGPAKGLVQQGVVAVAMAPSGDIIAGGGDGTVLVLKHDQEGQDARFLNKLPTLASIKLGSHISTLREDLARSNGRSVSLVCGTRQCDMYRVTYELQVRQFFCNSP